MVWNVIRLEYWSLKRRTPEGAALRPAVLPHSVSRRACALTNQSRSGSRWVKEPPRVLRGWCASSGEGREEILPEGYEGTEDSAKRQSVD